jgi:hypothetical protein
VGVGERAAIPARRARLAPLHPARLPARVLEPDGEPARVLFQAAPSGHEDYLDELAALLREAKGRPDPAAVVELRKRYDIEQLTALRNPAPATR